MSRMSVMFEVPEWVTEGLRKGTLERVGGVIRDRYGKKSVRAWLREGSLVNVDGPSPILQRQMGSLMMQGNVLKALSAVNIGVSVGGFALMYQKLGSLERQLAAVGEGVGRIEAAVDWLHEKDFIREVSGIRSVMMTLHEAACCADQALARSGLWSGGKDLLQAQVYFRHVLEALLERGLESRRSAEFIASYRAWVAAATGRVQVLNALGENELATASARDFRSDHAAFGKRLQKIVADPYRNLGDNHVTRQTLGEFLGHVNGVHEAIRGHVYFLEAFPASHEIGPARELPSCEGFALHVLNATEAEIPAEYPA